MLLSKYIVPRDGNLDDFYKLGYNMKLITVSITVIYFEYLAGASDGLM